MTRIIKGNYIYEFSHEHKPVASVCIGESFIVETIDCYSGNLQSENDLLTNFPHLKPNPATGPIFIENVSKGDLLEIHIQKIELSEYGIMPTRPNRGWLGEYIREPQTRILPIDNDIITLNETVQFIANKMIGVIGVAPDIGAVPNSTPGDHGGNMDTKDITEGNILYLPVFHPGGLLALGDLHAAMGDGELNGSGVEVGGKVTLTVNKIEGFHLNMPIVKTSNEVIIIASAKELQDAIKKCMKEAIRLIQQKNGLEFADAYRLVSAKGDLRISQLVNPEVTVRIALPKEWIAI
ncbi:acetamidase/formamidase family protein [Sporosarcina saromensis]|uniref:Acetamidase/formamidase family protein n=1 Tax=Sporosarcina saromensis TaxID=359365 RepID=A0ABU4GDX4_9BACL|nr:acetamidase/formamidase family protein [Sporosarcina saromensis]MDW0115194.1 acetamidase/formamidase family protein [Sporosarcina saromensis]